MSDRNHRYSDAIAVYDQILEANIVKKDRVCFVCYARAIGGDRTPNSIPFNA